MKNVSARGLVKTSSGSVYDLSTWVGAIAATLALWCGVLFTLGNGLPSGNFSKLQCLYIAATITGPVFAFRTKRQGASIDAVMVYLIASYFGNGVLGYSFLDVGGKLLRLMPYALTSLYFIWAIINQRRSIGFVARAAYVVYLGMCIIWSYRSPNTSVLVEAAILHGVFVPLAGVYALVVVAGREDSIYALRRGAVAGFLTIGVATISALSAGQAYKQTPNLLALRNILDGNAVVVYAAQLWVVAMLSNARWRAHVAIMAAVTVVVLITSVSRGAVVVYSAAFILLIISRLKDVVALLTLVASVAVVSVGLIIQLGGIEQIQNAWSLRFDLDTATGSGSLSAALGSLTGISETSGRTGIWKQAWEGFREAPLLGLGFGAFESISGGYREAHSLFLQVLVETGMVGFIFVYGTLARAIVAAMRARRSRSYMFMVINFGLVFLLLSHLVGSQFFVYSTVGVYIAALGPLLVYCAWAAAAVRLQPSGAPRASTMVVAKVITQQGARLSENSTSE